MNPRTICLLCIMMLPLTLWAQWSSNPTENLRISNLPNEQALPKIALSPTGDYYIGFFSSDGSNYNVRLQRLDNQGNPLWQENGLLISDHPSMSWLTDWDMTVDHEGYAILTWQDIRLAGENNVVAYRISPQGEFVWGPDGVQLSASSAFEVSPKVIVTQSNNAVFAWSSNNNVIIQQINPEGEKLWGEWGITLTSANRLTWPQMIPVGADDFILKLYEDSGPINAPTRHIIAQRYNSNGQPVWSTPTLVYNQGSIQAWNQILPFFNDGNDGFYIAWNDYRLSGTISSGWIQHVNPEGLIQFPVNGAQISMNNNFNKLYLKAAKPANDPNVYVFWNEVNGNQNQWGIYGQKIAPDGTRQWGENGTPLFEVGQTAYLPMNALAVEDDLVIVFSQPMEAPMQSSYHAVRVNPDGGFVWESVQAIISNAPSTKSHLNVSSFDLTQWAFAWKDERPDAPGIYIQNLLANGQLGITGPQVFTLQIEVEGLGSLEVNGQVYTQPITFEEGSQVDLLAIPADGWEFAGWSGDLISSNPSESLVMNSNKTILLTFEEAPPVLYQLTVIIDPGDGGSVEGAGEYAENEEVTLLATPSQDFIFLQWIDSNQQVMGTENHITIIMPGSDLIVTALFQSTLNTSDFADPVAPLIYPNPASEMIIIETPEAIENITLIDLSGKQILRVYSGESGKIALPIGGLPSGVYLLELKGAKKKSTHRVTITR